MDGVSVSGNRAVGTAEILGWMKTRPGDSFSGSLLDADLREVASAYRSLGYLAVGVGPPVISPGSDSSRISVHVPVVEGNRTLVGRVRFLGQAALPEEALEAICETRAGRPLVPEVLERDMEGILEQYEREGYPFAACVVESIGVAREDSAGGLDLLLRLTEGPRITIDEVRVEGNTGTQPEVILREVRFGRGEAFHPDRVAAFRARLLRLHIFSEVAEPRLYVRGGRGGLLLSVREGASSTFDGVVGYVPAGPRGEPAYATGLVSLSMRNLFGTGRGLGLRWQREDRLSQEIGIRYTEPWVFGLPVNLQGAFSQRRQDTTYVRRTVDAKWELMLSENLTVSGILSTESVIPSDSVPRRIGRSSTLLAGAELAYDTRDDPVGPSHGVRYRADYRYGTKRVQDPVPGSAPGPSAGSSVRRFGMDSDFYVPVFRRQVAAFGLHLRDLRGGDGEESDLYRLGGTRTLRGYRENEFAASRAAWSSAEYRFVLARRSFVYAFLDAAYFLRPADVLLGIGQKESWKAGYGLGLQVQTALGVIGVSFALGEGDAFSETKVHIGLLNEF